MLPAVRDDVAKVCGVSITSHNLETAIHETLRLTQAGTPSAVFTLNLDHAVKLQRDPRFRAAYAAADVVTADGWPIAWIARLQDARVKCTTGADLFLPLTDAAAQRQIPVFLIGSSPGVLARAGKELCQRTEGTIAITGTLAPSQSFDPEGAEADAAIEKIRLSGAKLCFAALGAPKQEIFALRAREQGLHCCVVCVGAALDFTAGEQIRAPEVLRDNGLRWGWRLGSNLHRLAKRYVESAVMFAYLLATEPRRHRLSRAQKSI